ncbi:enoyl-CoA hydratase, EchA3 domain protein, partial [Mycobacterium xenopi 4042]
GHAIAMGAFLLSSGIIELPRRLQHSGQRGRDRYDDSVPGVGNHEASVDAVGVSAGRWAGQTFFGETAIAAGWIDEIVLPEMVRSRAEEAAREFATLNQHAHAATKLRTRAEALNGIRAGIDGMATEFGL